MTLALVGMHLLSIHGSSHYYETVQGRCVTAQVSRTYESFTPGVYAVWDNGATLGTYRNSYRNTATYAGYTYSLGNVSLLVGALGGYGGKVRPLVAPSLRAGDDPWGVRIALIPRITRQNPAVLHFAIERKL